MHAYLSTCFWEIGGLNISINLLKEPAVFVQQKFKPCRSWSRLMISTNDNDSDNENLLHTDTYQWYFPVDYISNGE